MSPRYEGKPNRIVPAESVFGVIAVKSQIDGREFRDVCSKIADGIWIADAGMVIWGPNAPGSGTPTNWHPAIDDPSLDRTLYAITGQQDGDVLIGLISTVTELLSRPLPQLDLVSYLSDA
jgi:hypothetical protein